MRRRVLLILGGLGLACAGLGFAAWTVWPRPEPAPPWGGDYDTTARPPERIAPGTVIDRSAPPGWSHLVIKSLPRVKPGTEGRVPGNLVLGREGTIRMASWMFTAFLADVVPEEHAGRTRHRLRAVGLGLGTTVNGRDTVVTPETAKQFGVDLGWITEEILATGYRVQGQAVMAVHGPSFGLMDTPVWFRCGEKNLRVRYRYALLVDPPTGRLDVLMWPLGADAGECGDLSRAIWMNPDTIDVPELIVDPAAFNALGIPNEASFGVEKLPAGRATLDIPADLRPLAGRTRFTPEEAGRLEAGLRNLLAP